MGLIAVPGAGPLLFPGALGTRFGAVPATAAVVSLSAAGARAAILVRCPKAGTLDKFEWMNQSYSGTNTVRHSFQDVDPATGFPDGVVDQFRTGNPGNGLWVTPGLITSDGTDTGTKRTVAKGEILACVIDFSAYTNGTNSIRGLNDTSQLVNQYLASFNGVSWARAGTSSLPLLALKYDDGTYGFLRDWIWPITAITARTLNTGSTPDEIGVKFQVPWDCVVDGAHVMAAVTDDLDVVLYDANDNVLASGSIDKDVISAVTAGIHVVVFPAAATLSRNTTYRLVIKPTTANNVTVYDATGDAVALMAAMPAGANWVMTERTNAGAWTDTTTRTPWLHSLMVSSIGDSASAIALGVSDGLR